MVFTSDSCWGSSYPSSRRHRRSTHGDGGNSGGGGIGGDTICISGTWSQSQTENQKSKVWWPRYYINLKLWPVVNAVGGKAGAIAKGWASNEASTLVIKRDKMFSVDQLFKSKWAVQSPYFPQNHLWYPPAAIPNCFLLYLKIAFTDKINFDEKKGRYQLKEW